MTSTYRMDQMADNGTPAPSYEEQIKDALKNDTTLLGRLFEVRAENKSAQSIADELGVGSVGTVYNYESSVKTLLQGTKIVNGTPYANQKASMLRGFAKRHADILSPSTKRKLADLADEHQAFANNEEVITRENQEIERGLENDDRLNEPGVYVYTYPHYYRSPVEKAPDGDAHISDRTFLKVGVTESTQGASRRIQSQISQIRTALPEPPLILRIYNRDGVNLKETEKLIHRHLDAADHDPINRKQKGLGTEWFLTHLTFLDSTADLLGLEIRYKHPEEDGS